MALVVLLTGMNGAHADEQGWQALKNGQAVIYRHALAPGGGDPANFQIGDCSTQRNLNDIGREQARVLGQRLKNQGITVARVLTSQWCRCRETAELMDIGPVIEEPAFNSFFQDRSTEGEQTDAARALLAGWKPEDGALVIVTHQVNITALTGIFPQSGEGIVVSTGPDGVRVLGRLEP